MAATLPRTALRRLPRSVDRLERMSPERRLHAYRCGIMIRAERTAWAAHFPEEVPLVNDEYEWLVADLE
jgi:hypothetical protein